MTNKWVAIKKLTDSFQHPIAAKRAYRELKLLKLFNHRNVIGFVDAFTPQKTPAAMHEVYLVMELMEGHLGQAIPRLDRFHRTISFLLYQILCGIKYLHTGGIIHRVSSISHVPVINLNLIRIVFQ